MLKCATLAAVLLLPACATTWNHPNVLLLKGSRGMSSGVVIADGWILTAGHVLPVATAGGLECGPAIPHPTLDLALIPCPGAKAYGLRPATKLPWTYDRVSAYGWHKGEYLMKTAGYQAKQRGWMSAASIHGCSGGAVVNARGELVGILVQVRMTDVQNGWGEYALPHIARYTVLNEAVRSWIGANIR